MIRKILASALALALLAGPAAAQGTFILRKPDNSGPVDPANKANQESEIAQATAANAALGAKGDNAWSGTGDGSLIAIDKAIRNLLAGTLTVQFPSAQAITCAACATSAKQDTGNSSLASIDSKLTGVASGSKQDTGNASLASIAASAAPYATPTAMTVGSTYAAGRAVAMYCTASGDVALTLSGGGTLTLPVNGGTGGLLTVVPLAATKVNTSGTTATCTYTSLS